MMRLPPPDAVIRVALVEDHARLRSLLRRELASAPDLRVVGEASSGPEAIALVESLQPDVLVLDIELGDGLDGVEVASAVAGGPCRVLAHSSHADPVHVAHLYRAGAAGYLSKEAPIGRVVPAVRAVAAGEGRWFTGRAPTPVELSAGQRAALDHFARGGRPLTLGAALGTGPDATAEALAGLYAAFGASSWYEALAHAWALGLVGRGRVGEPAVGYGAGAWSRSNVPGQASSARPTSYGA